MTVRCPHCGREIIAERIGEGMRVLLGKDPAFVLASSCPYPCCSQRVFARAPPLAGGGHEALLVLVTLDDVVAWSPRSIVRAATDWLCPCAFLLAFALVPVWGFAAALDSMRCGGVGWYFFIAGSLLALVPVIFFVRGFTCAAHDGLRLAYRARAELRYGHDRRGLRLTPASPRAYRSY
jgi:hypothetical protein